jgi:hypothetical protein
LFSFFLGRESPAAGGCFVSARGIEDDFCFLEPERARRKKERKKKRGRELLREARERIRNRVLCERERARSLRQRERASGDFSTATTLSLSFPQFQTSFLVDSFFLLLDTSINPAFLPICQP